MKGYKLIEALRKEADEIATESRAGLVREAAKEIENLILQNRALQEACTAALPWLEAALADEPDDWDGEKLGNTVGQLRNAITKATS